MKNEHDMQYIEATQTLVGTKKRTLVDTQTGERIEVDQVTKLAYGQKAFWKLYLMDFLRVLGIFENKQIDVLVYILENTFPATNQFIGTYRKIADGSGCSIDTVRRTITRLLQKSGDIEPLLKKVQTGVYVVNPLIMYKGTEHKKQLLIRYCDENVQNGSEGEQLTMDEMKETA